MKQKYEHAKIRTGLSYRYKTKNRKKIIISMCKQSTTNITITFVHCTSITVVSFWMIATYENIIKLLDEENIIVNGKP